MRLFMHLHVRALHPFNKVNEVLKVILASAAAKAEHFYSISFLYVISLDCTSFTFDKSIKTRVI